jgi:excisionase family DNA binding protein
MSARAMTVAEFGERLGISRRSAYRVVAAGLVDLTDVGTRARPRLRITEQALERYLERRRIPGRKAS